MYKLDGLVKKAEQEIKKFKEKNEIPDAANVGEDFRRIKKAIRSLVGLARTEGFTIRIKGKLSMESSTLWMVVEIVPRGKELGFFYLDPKCKVPIPIDLSYPHIVILQLFFSESFKTFKVSVVRELKKK